MSKLTPEAIAKALTEMRSWPALPGGSTETACAALEAIGKVRELHEPSAIYSECDCTDENHGGREVVEVGNYDFYTCSPPDYLVCSECCASDGEQEEHCASGHDHGPGKPHCKTIAVIDGEETK